MLHHPIHWGVRESFERKNPKFLPCCLLLGISVLVNAGTELHRFLRVCVLIILVFSVISLSTMAVAVQRNGRGRAHVCTWTHVCSGGIKQCRVNTLCFKVSFLGGGGKRYLKVKGKH